MGNLLYYGKIFAGGDAKLMIALGTVLPFSPNLIGNLQIFISFLFLFFLCGSVYGIAASGYFALRNFKNFRKEFVTGYKQSLTLTIALSLLGLLIMIYGLFFIQFLFYFGIFVFILPLLYVYLKSVDNSCMLKRINPKFLMEGDWLYKDVKVGSKIIKANWEGLKKEDIKLLVKKKRLVTIRQGVAFGPVFLISFLILFLSISLIQDYGILFGNQIFLESIFFGAADFSFLALSFFTSLGFSFRISNTSFSSFS